MSSLGGSGGGGDRTPRAGAPGTDEVRAALDRLLGSSQFRGSDRHRRFLQFIVTETLEGRGGSIKESVVAAEVFGRAGAFDPRTDSVVRVEARNLRARLNEYYLGEGSGDPVAIELPKGTYAPVFRPAATAAGIAPTRAAAPRRTWMAGTAILIAIMALGSAGWWWVKRQPAGSGEATASVAVLPFTDLSGGTDDRLFADGLVEDLTSDLATLPGLKVAARTSAFQFRGKSEDVREIGRRLGVAALLEGSVRRQKGQVRIGAQLVDARTGYHLWAQVYERDLAGVEDAEREIRQAVAGALKVPVPSAVAARHVPPPEARDAYWRGRYLRGKWQAPQEALSYFERAVALDPEYAEAWAALAALHGNMAFQAVKSVDAEAEKAREAARKALALDSSAVEGYLALASLGCYYDRDWPAAERAFRRALDLNRSSAGAHRAYALGLAAHGRFEESIAHLNAAQGLDPLSTVTTNNLATTLYLAHRYDEAIQAARRHLAMDPGFYPAREMLGTCFAQQGRLEEAIQELRKANEALGGPLEFLGDLGYALARAGKREEAGVVAKQILAASGESGMGGVALAKILAAQGDARGAVEWLRRASAAHVANAVFIGVEPEFDGLRSDSAFRALCSELGLPVR